MSYSGVTIFESSELLICRVHQFGLECASIWAGVCINLGWNLHRDKKS